MGEALTKVLKEHLEGDRQLLVDLIVENGPEKLDEYLPYIRQLKAQINTWEQLTDLKEFLSTELEETNQDEVQSIGTENSN